MKDTIIFSDKVTYLKNEEIIFTEGNSSAIIENKYDFKKRKIPKKTNNYLLSINRL